MGKRAEALYREREKRVTDAIRLKVPDRVPIITGIGYFPAKYTGITCEAAWYDYDEWLAAYRGTLRDFQPDMMTIQPFFPGKAMEYLEPKSVKWPGHGVSPYHGHQSIEEEYMKSDEYDVLLRDPTDFSLRVFMPRVAGAASGLEMLPRVSSLGYSFMAAQALAEALARPEVARAIRAMQRAGREIRKWRPKIMAFSRAMEDMGFPPYSQGAALAPFDGLSHSMRGIHGSFADMFRQPDRVLEACEKLLSLTLAQPLPPPNRCGNIRIFMPLTRGSDDFMSLTQFETFYWPTLKKLIESFIDRGATPCIFFEGNFITRLEYLLDLPRGKILAQLDTTDMSKAKEILKDHVCIRGNVPSSLLQVGTVQEVKDYCKKLIDVVGKDGGFILSPRSSTDEVNPENFRAMIEFTREYGRYR
jgi:hypothetical protein